MKLRLLEMFFSYGILTAWVSVQVGAHADGNREVMAWPLSPSSLGPGMGLDFRDKPKEMCWWRTVQGLGPSPCGALGPQSLYVAQNQGENPLFSPTNSTDACHVLWPSSWCEVASSKGRCVQRSWNLKKEHGKQKQRPLQGKPEQISKNRIFISI